MIIKRDTIIKNLENLISLSTNIINSWSKRSISKSNLLKTDSFVKYILKESRITHNTFYLSLYYLLCLKNNIYMKYKINNFLNKYTSCGRRMFLISLILSNKYLNDKSYDTRYWSKITKLKSSDIKLHEIHFIMTINYKLHITENNFHKWCNKLNKTKKLELDDLPI